MDNRTLQAQGAPLGASQRPAVAGSIRGLVLTLFSVILAAVVTWLETGGAEVIGEQWAVYVPLFTLIGRAIEGVIDDYTAQGKQHDQA